jgi:type I restriction enzyme S subunit
MQEKYKSMSNVPNLRFSEFSGEWEVKKLGEITSWSSGGTPTKDNPLFWDGDIPWISASSMRGIVYSDSELKITQAGLKTGSKLAKTGTLLILVRGSMLFNKIPIGIVSKDVAFNQDVKSIIVNNYSTSEYILNWFGAFEPKILNMVTGTGIGAGKLDLLDLKALEIKIPFLPEQQKIASFLSLIHDRIQTQSKIIGELKVLKTTLRNRLFQDIINQGYESVMIKDVLEYEQPTKYLVSSTDYSSNDSLVPVLTANKAFILGYTDEVFGIYEKGDCIIFDDFTMDMKYVEFQFKVKSSAIKILKPKSDVNLKFVFEYLLYLNLKSGEHKRHYISEIELMVIDLPNYNVQNNTAEFLSNIDKKIDVEMNIFTLLTKQKKYLLSNLFI